MHSILQIKNVSLSLKGESLLEDLDLSLYEKSFHTILGDAGSGKSAFLKLLGGYFPPEKGKIHFSDTRRNYFLILYPDEFLFPMNLLETVRKYRSVFPQWSNDTFNRLRKQRNFSIRKDFSDMSETHRREFLLVMSLAAKPKMILIDDFSHSLDQEGQKFYLDHLRNFADEGGSVVITDRSCDSHIMDVSDHLFTLKDKKLVEHKEEALERLVG